jgi:adenosylhomocysteine nucleosidase
VKTEKRKAVIIISADVEWCVVTPLFPQAKQQSTPYGNWFETTLPRMETPVLFFHGGWGKIAAAASAQYAIDRWNPDLLVNLGTCGGFDGAVNHHEVLLVEKTIVYDIIEQMSETDDYLNHYITEIDLSWLSEPYPHPVKRSLMVSGDRDLLVEDLPGLQTQFGAVAGDWESGAIAYVANRNQTHLLILRGVSDVVGSSGSQAYGNLGYFETQAEKVLNYLIQTLPNWLRAGNII